MDISPVEDTDVYDNFEFLMILTQTRLSWFIHGTALGNMG
jgi:hypothetical protein